MRCGQGSLAGDAVTEGNEVLAPITTAYARGGPYAAAGNSPCPSTRVTQPNG
jgi:hypothetical protein